MLLGVFCFQTILLFFFFFENIFFKSWHNWQELEKFIQKYMRFKKKRLKTEIFTHILATKSIVNIWLLYGGSAARKRKIIWVPYVILHIEIYWYRKKNIVWTELLWHIVMLYFEHDDCLVWMAAWCQQQCQNYFYNIFIFLLSYF